MSGSERQLCRGSQRFPPQGHLCVPAVPTSRGSHELCCLPELVAAGSQKKALSRQCSQHLSSSSLPRGQEDICALCCKSIIFAGLICLLSAPSHGPARGASPLFMPLDVNSRSSRQDMPTRDIEHWFRQVVAAVECAGNEASADRGQHAARLEKIYRAILSSLQAG